jgi:hypothetical protein
MQTSRKYKVYHFMRSLGISITPIAHNTQTSKENIDLRAHKSTDQHVKALKFWFGTFFNQIHSHRIIKDMLWILRKSY